MIYNAGKQAETIPPDRLPLDVIYLAVRRLVAGEGDEPASAPGLVVINLSLGDLNRPFTRRMSLWARLIDWLSFQHRVLFLVSVGNVRQWLPVRTFVAAERRPASLQVVTLDERLADAMRKQGFAMIDRATD
ncbi:MAG TPA: hypothetical protein VND19_12610 [Acetobacteraceae bacterium]|nr:hypothetical protein [Acetobacteraceae bacterium]